MNEEYRLFQDLQNDIQLQAGLSRTEATGFYSLHCPICKNDRKTGGLKFEHDKIIYNCFRGSCDSNTVYTLGEYIPRKFRHLMDVIGVKIPFKLKAKRPNAQKRMEESLNSELFIKHGYTQVDIPDEFVPLRESEHRKVSYWENWFFERATPSTGVYMCEGGKYRGKCAIPMYYFNKCIGFQIVTGDDNVKYIKETFGKNNEHMVYIPERVIETPLIIVEGGMDAKCFPNTCATLSSKLTQQQAYMIRDAKEWWFLPDRSSNNFLPLMKKYKNAKMIVPNWDEHDLNGAVIKYGVMEIAERIRDCLYSDYTKAKLAYDMWRVK